MTINKAISIYNDGVGEAGVVSQNTNGITIAAGASDVVNLRGLILNGSSSSGSGVQITSAGRVNIQNCVIQQFGSGTGQGGINISPSSGAMEVKVQDTTIINNNIGMFVKPTGGATVDLSIDHTRIDNNLGGGMRADGTGGGTVFAGITDSSMSLNAANGVVAIAGPGSATVSLMRDVFHGNGQYGLQSSQSSGTAVITVGQSVLSNNTSGAVNVAGGTLQTYQTNQITGSLGTGFSGTISQQ